MAVFSFLKLALSGSVLIPLAALSTGHCMWDHQACQVLEGSLWWKAPAGIQTSFGDAHGAQATDSRCRRKTVELAHELHKLGSESSDNTLSALAKDGCDLHAEDRG